MIKLELTIREAQSLRSWINGRPEGAALAIFWRLDRAIEFAKSNAVHRAALTGEDEDFGDNQ